MTVKNRERGINMIIALIVSFSGVFMAFKLNDSADREQILKESIELKADIIDVNKDNAKQDESIKANSEKIETNYKRIDEKIDKIYEYIIDKK